MILSQRIHEKRPMDSNVKKYRLNCERSLSEMTGQEACSSVRVVPGTCDPAAAQCSTRAAFLLGLWAVTTLWSTAGHLLPRLSCVGKSCVVLRMKALFHGIGPGAQSHPGRDGEETGQEV